MILKKYAYRARGNIILCIVMILLGIILSTSNGIGLQLRLYAAPPHLEDPPPPPPECPKADKAKRVYLFDATTLTPLCGKNENEPSIFVSITKIMTGLVVVQQIEKGNVKIDEPISIRPETLFYMKTQAPYSSNAAASLIGLRPSEQWTIKQLLHGLLLRSGSDAAYVLADYIGRKNLGRSELGATAEVAVKQFVTMMNKEVVDIGKMMSSAGQQFGLSSRYTAFISPAGEGKWTETNQGPRHLFANSSDFGTARTITLIAAEAMKHPLFAEVVSTPRFKDKNKTRKINFKNDNALVQPDSPYYYPGANGIKYGQSSVPGGGYNFVFSARPMSACQAGLSSADENGHLLIGTVMYPHVISYEDGEQYSLQDAKTLLDWGFKGIAENASQSSPPPLP